MIDRVAQARWLGSRRAAALPALVAALAGILASLAGLAGTEHGLRSVRDAVRHQAASGDLHIVEIDARSLAAIQRWPWPRGLHARAIDRLTAARARTIAFDVDFSSHSDSREDAKLAYALERAGGAVILPTFSQLQGASGTTLIDNLPIPALRVHATLAAVTIVPDRDGVVRTAPAGIQTRAVPRPSLAALLAETSAEIDRFFPIDYAIDPATIPRHSFVDLIEGRIDPALLAGKRVLIGATAVEMGDRYAVPRYGVIPGVVIQALAAETLAAGPIPSSGGPLPAALLVLVLIAAACASKRIQAGPVAIAVAFTGLLMAPLLTQSLWSFDFATAPALVMTCAAAAVMALQWALARYAGQSAIDSRTGLPNRIALQAEREDADRHLLAVAHIGECATLASSLGPDAMAELCRKVAERLALATGDRTIYQVGEGDLAWVIAPGDEAAACDRFDALSTLLRAPVEVKGRRVDVTIGFGIAESPSIPHAAANAVLAASQALAQGSRWQRYIAGREDDTQWRLSLLGELDDAIDAGQIFVVYQPKQNLRSGAITCAEALVRWQHPERGFIPPDEFIGFAERGGRIDRLTRFVLTRALADVKASGNAFAVAVNVSAILLLDDRVVDLVKRALRETGVPPTLLTLEITESAVMQETDRAVAVLAELRQLGLRISIDDYGTGQSTLSYLKRLPAAELKIDKCFVQAITDSRSDAILVASTINLAHELNLEVVAEGVETQACLDQLRAMGCTYGQGYHIGKPMPIAAFRAVLGNERQAQAA